MKASVVIITRDRAPFLSRCLEALARQRSLSHKWEVFVADFASCDSTPALLREWSKLGGLPFELHWESIELRVDYGRMRDEAVARTRGEFVFFIDDDCEAPADWLEGGLRRLEDADAVGGLVVSANRLDFGRWWHPELAWLAGLGVPGILHPEEAGAVYYPQTANLGVRRSTIERFTFQSLRTGNGPSEETLLGREDANIWRRWRREGMNLRVDPTWLVFHRLGSERSTLRNALHRARRDGRAEAWLRFNPEAAVQAARAIPQETLGGVGNLSARLLAPFAKEPGLFRHARPAGPPLLWALRESAHLRNFRSRAPKKWRRPLWGALAEGTLRGGTDQAKRAGASLLRRLTSGRVISSIPERPQRVEVFADAFLGDMILLAPVFKALKVPESSPELVLVTHERFGRALFENCPYVDAVVSFDDRAGMEKLSRQRSRPEETLILLPYWHDEPFMTLESVRPEDSPPFVTFDWDINLGRRRHRDRAARLIAKLRDRHELENLARLFQWAGLRQPPQKEDFSFLEDDPRALEAAPPGCIVLHPWATRRDKDWTPSRWARVGKALAAETGRPLVILQGGRGDRNAAANWIHLHAIPAIDWLDAEGGSVRGMFTLLRRAVLLVTTCSGPKHAAMAVGCPTVTLYGGSDPRRWGAWFDRERHVALQRAPFGLTPAERANWLPNHEMLCIDPEEVVQAALDLLSRTRPEQQH